MPGQRTDGWMYRTYYTLHIYIIPCLYTSTPYIIDDEKRKPSRFVHGSFQAVSTDGSDLRPPREDTRESWIPVATASFWSASSTSAVSPSSLDTPVAMRSMITEKTMPLRRSTLVSTDHILQQEPGREGTHDGG